MRLNRRTKKRLCLGLWLFAATIAAVGFALSVLINDRLQDTYKVADVTGIFVGWVVVVAFSIGIASDM